MPKNYHLYLKGEVGDWDFDADYVSYILDKYKDQRVNVLIDSLGGQVAVALSISSLFRAHGDVHVHFVGMNASAATIAAMGAKYITIDSAACFLVHKCLNFVDTFEYMNEEQLDAHISKLRKVQENQQTINNCVCGLYAKRCAKPEADLMELMKKGGWMTAEQTKEWGFVDEVTDYPGDAAPELTESVASMMAEAGMPMPPIEMRRAKEDSFFARLRRFFEGGSRTDITNKPENMDTPFASLTPLLGAETMTVTNAGTCSLTSDQLTAIDSALASKDAAIAEKDAKITELEALVADLRQTPAETTDPINEAGKGTEIPGPGDDVDDIVAALAKAYRH